MLREEIGLSQATFGSLGFISAPGWIKLENGQRLASEKLVDNLIAWLVKEKHLRATAAKKFREELLTLKYLGSNSAFVRALAKNHAQSTPEGTALLAEAPGGKKKPGRRGRPAKKTAAPKD